MSDYNHAEFNLKREEPRFVAFQDFLHVGERAPSFPLEDLASGETVEMKSLWAKDPVIIECGSFT